MKREELGVPRAKERGVEPWVTVKRGAPEPRVLPDASPKGPLISAHAGNCPFCQMISEPLRC